MCEKIKIKTQINKFVLGYVCFKVCGDERFQNAPVFAEYIIDVSYKYRSFAVQFVVVIGAALIVTEFFIGASGKRFTTFEAMAGFSHNRFIYGKQKYNLVHSFKQLAQSVSLPVKSKSFQKSHSYEKAFSNPVLYNYGRLQQQCYRYNC